MTLRLTALLLLSRISISAGAAAVADRSRWRRP